MVPAKSGTMSIACAARPLHCCARLINPAKLEWIIVGWRGIVVSPQTARNGIVVIDPYDRFKDFSR